MTHDELLERLDELKYDVGDSGMNEEYKAIHALRAVVELHKPNKYNLCEICRWYMNKHKYPCPTIQAIEEELQ